MSESEVSSTSKWRWYEFQRRLTLMLLFFVAVVLVVIEIQIQQRNSQLTTTQKIVTQGQIAADNARKASEKASSDLAEALTQLNSVEAKTATQQYRQNVVDIEYFLCNGPCPKAPITAPGIAHSTN